jgi:hypothetical protein
MGRAWDCVVTMRRGHPPSSGWIRRSVISNNVRVPSTGTHTLGTLERTSGHNRSPLPPAMITNAARGFVVIPPSETL